MRIIQTFWSGGKSLLQDGFGWLHPEYNLMSWALSCLSLREHYDQGYLVTKVLDHLIFPVNKYTVYL